MIEKYQKGHSTQIRSTVQHISWVIFFSSVGELYFKMEKLKNFAGPNQQSLAGFEKIRTVGKGDFTHVLLCIL